MKKFFAAALALTMTAAMFTACGDDSSSSSKASSSSAASSAAESSSAAEASSADDASSAADDASSTADDASSAADDASSEGGDASSEGGAAEGAPVDENGKFDVTKMPGYDANAKETVLTVAEPGTDPWVNGLGADVDYGDIYIDGRTFTRDQDLTVKVEFEVAADAKEEFELGIKKLESLDDSGTIKKGTTQILIGPARANGWAKFVGADNHDGLIVDFPTYYNMPEGDTHGKTKTGKDGSEDVFKADGTLEDVFVKNDGFIKFGSPDATTVEFTIPKETVNAIIDNATATPADENDTTTGWDGLLFQMGDCPTAIKTVTLNMGNVYFSTDISKAMDGAQ
ncbi:hypothetical protein [Ruminococcus sp. NK3A76]|uniref:hypothetical protein n=1 Tax=Ruminococcus sp. NK3A76 TaxID=877411 RepID=UPI00068C6457|nr:hypothetical protein [Ruminococcus sp. NK3A76]